MKQHATARRLLLTLCLALCLVLTLSATALAVNMINNVNIKDLTLPEGGFKPDFTVTTSSDGGGNTYSCVTVYSVNWWGYTEKRFLTANDTFVAGQKYKCEITIYPKSTDYKFDPAEQMTVYVQDVANANVKVEPIDGNSRARVIYFNATAAGVYIAGNGAYTTATNITSVSLSGLILPVAGRTPDTTPPLAEGDGVDVYGVRWSDVSANQLMTASSTFKAGQPYRCYVYLQPEDGYAFAAVNKMSGVCEGQTATVTAVDGNAAKRCMVFTYVAEPERIVGASVTIAAPVVGAKPASTATARESAYTVASVSWEPADSAFVAGKSYTAIVSLETTNGQVFAVTPASTINNMTAKTISGGGSQELRISYTFPALAAAAAAPISVNYDQTDVEAAIGGSVALTARTDLDLMLADNLRIQWYKATGNYYGSGTAISGATGFTYAAPTDQAGTAYYYCEVSATVMGEALTSASDEALLVKVTVKAGLPVITSQPKAVDAKPGDTVTFTVTASGTELHYQWWVVDAGVPAKIGTASATLTLANVSISQHNNYDFWCVVSNAAGEATSAKARLTVSEQPYVFSLTDVPESAWYYESVKAANRLGLINGKTATTFCPNDNMTYAEAIKLAACMHQLYTEGAVTLGNGGPWYITYYDYCRDKGIIPTEATAQEPGYVELQASANVIITRAQYALLFSRALPDAALAAKNTIPDNSLPDVSMTQSVYDQAIYKLYRAGIVNGSDAKGSFNPNSNIKRSEVAAILIRMMDETVRVGAPSGLGK